MTLRGMLGWHRDSHQPGQAVELPRSAAPTMAEPGQCRDLRKVGGKAGGAESLERAEGGRREGGLGWPREGDSAKI